MALDRRSGSPTRLCPYQREIADANSDPEIERDVLTAVLTKTPNVRAGARWRRTRLEPIRPVEFSLAGQIEVACQRSMVRTLTRLSAEVLGRAVKAFRLSRMVCKLKYSGAAPRQAAP